MTQSPEFIATCWTSAGNVTPLHEDQTSPFSFEDRVAAVARTGWSGIGLAQDDLAHIRDSIGFTAAREIIQRTGLRYTEVELLGDWWETGSKREKSDRTRNLLFEAASELDATHIKISTAFGEPLGSVDHLARELQTLSDDAQDHGVRLALEPMPFTVAASVPLAADLIRAVDHPSCGLVIDSWHVFRAGTTLRELGESLAPEMIFGVELNDADEAVGGTLLEDTVNNRKLLGEGAFDLRGLVRVLYDLGYEGPWGVEIISEAHRMLPLEVALQSAHDSGVELFRAL